MTTFKSQLEGSNLGFLNKKYNKGRYNNIHGTIDDINLYIEQNIIFKIKKKNQVFETKYKLLHSNVMAAILDSQNALEVIT